MKKGVKKSQQKDPEVATQRIDLSLEEFYKNSVKDLLKNRREEDHTLTSYQGAKQRYAQQEFLDERLEELERNLDVYHKSTDKKFIADQAKTRKFLEIILNNIVGNEINPKSVALAVKNLTAEFRRLKEVSDKALQAAIATEKAATQAKAGGEQPSEKPKVEEAPSIPLASLPALSFEMQESLKSFLGRILKRADVKNKAENYFDTLTMALIGIREKNRKKVYKSKFGAEETRSSEAELKFAQLPENKPSEAETQFVGAKWNTLQEARKARLERAQIAFVTEWYEGMPSALTYQQMEERNKHHPYIPGKPEDKEKRKKRIEAVSGLDFRVKQLKAAAVAKNIQERARKASVDMTKKHYELDEQKRIELQQVGMKPVSFTRSIGITEGIKPAEGGTWNNFGQEAVLAPGDYVNRRKQCTEMFTPLFGRKVVTDANIRSKTENASFTTSEPEMEGILAKLASLRVF